MSESNKNTAMMLEQVDNAIISIMAGGQSYTIGSRSLTRADLATLKAMKADLEAQIAEEANNSSLLGRTFVAFFDGR